MKWRLAEAHVDGVVEPLHPDRHLGSAPGARPAVRHPMERLPETPPEADLECQHYRTFCESGTRSDGTNGFTGIRRNLPLLQRGRYSVILDKETDVRLRERGPLTATEALGQVSGTNNCFCDRCDSERREETEGTAPEGFTAQRETLPPWWAERPAISARAPPMRLNDYASAVER